MKISLKISYTFFIFFLAKFSLEQESVVLTDDNFNSTVMVSQYPWFIKFYSPYWLELTFKILLSGHCTALAPTWKKFSEEFSVKLNQYNFSKDPLLKIGEVDCTKQLKTASQFKINAYPTLLYFPSVNKTLENSQSFKESRTIEMLSEWVLSILINSFNNKQALKQLNNDKTIDLDAILGKETEETEEQQIIENNFTDFINTSIFEDNNSQQNPENQSQFLQKQIDINNLTKNDSTNNITSNRTEYKDWSSIKEGLNEIAESLGNYSKIIDFFQFIF